MTRAMTDLQLEAVLGCVTNIRGATLEEGADMLADFLRGQADRGSRTGRVWVSTAVLRNAARTIDALVCLSREGDDA